MVGAGVNSVMTVAVYDKSLRLSRASLEGPRLGQVLNFQVTMGAASSGLLLFLPPLRGLLKRLASEDLPDIL